MLLILYIIFFDPTLPLPDLSKVVFPEPRLWIPQERDHVTIEGYGLDHYGGMLRFQMGYFDLQAIYDHNLDWDTTDRATLNVNQHIITHNFWLKPSVTAMYYARNRTYLNSQASCTLNYYLPWSLLSGQVMADNWFINSDHHRQLEASFSIIFDRLKFPYCIGILTRLDDRTYGYSFTNIRIGSFFIELSSSFPANFPSPRLEIKYVEPGFVIGQKIESGIFEQTFQTYLDINSPGYFSYPAPSESLDIRLNTFCKFKILGQSLIINNTYAYWQCYPTWNRYLRHASIPEMQNNDLMINLVNTIKSSTRCNIKNSVGVGYYWSDSRILRY